MLRPPNRAIMVLFACAALASTGMFTAITIGAIAAVETANSRSASGLPAALAILGTAGGALVLGALMARSSWRLGMRVGWIIGAFGGAIAAIGVQQGSFLLVLVGMFAIGTGNAGTQLARYAAAETVTASERGRAVAWTVWAAAIGAVLGPLSLGVTGNIAAGAGLERGVGAFGLVVVTLAAAVVVVSLFRPVPVSASEPPEVDATEVTPLGAPDVVDDSAAAPVMGVAAAVGSLVAAQACMVMVMAITPVHLDDGGHDYGVVGTVMSSHFVGMFALAPLVGWLVDRTSTALAVRVGLVTLAVGSILAAALPLEHGGVLSLPLLLVGLGWCVCFVSASAAVASVVSGARAQGRLDSLVWLGSATSSVVSGVLLDVFSYATVAILSAVIVLLVAAYAAVRSDLRPRARPA